MQKYFASIFTDKKGYGLSQYNLEEFYEKIKNKGHKIHYFALKFTVGPPNCITGASKSWSWGGGPVNILTFLFLKMLRRLFVVAFKKLKFEISFLHA